MRVKVLREFKDKKTGKRMFKGSEAEYSEDRIKEILKKGDYIEVIKEVEDIIFPEVETSETSKQPEKSEGTTDNEYDKPTVEPKESEEPVNGENKKTTKKAYK